MRGLPRRLMSRLAQPIMIGCDAALASGACAAWGARACAGSFQMT